MDAPGKTGTLHGGRYKCLCPQGEPQPLLASLRDSPRQAESSEIRSILGIHTTVSLGVTPRGNPACRGTFGGRRKAVRDRLALQGGTGDFP